MEETESGLWILHFKLHFRAKNWLSESFVGIFRQSFNAAPPTIQHFLYNSVSLNGTTFRPTPTPFRQWQWRVDKVCTYCHFIDLL